MNCHAAVAVGRAALRVAAVLIWVGVTAVSLHGQEVLDPALEDRCEDLTPGENPRALCEDAALSIQLTQPELGLALAAGNPVLGTGSPIGTKFRFIPRIHIGGRISWVWVEIPDLLDYPESRVDPIATRSFSVPVAQLDLSVGVFDGLRLGNTLSGLAAVELLGTVGPIMLPNSAGFENDVTGWGIGARVGVLRESFTAPGISLSAMYKWHGRVEYGDTGEGDAAEFGLDMRVASFRAGLSKSFVALGLALTLGYDSYWSDVDFTIRPPPDGPAVTVVPEDDPAELKTGRWSAFVDVSYIVLYFNIVAEAGWLEEQKLRSSRGDELESGNFFGALGIRLTL